MDGVGGGIAQNLLYTRVSIVFYYIHNNTQHHMHAVHITATREENVVVAVGLLHYSLVCAVRLID